MRDVIILRIIIPFLALLALTKSSDINITIFRNSTNVDNLSNSYDQFNISSKYCGNNVDHCKSFGGEKIEGDCHCKCNASQSTFGFYNRHWRCTKNIVVRQHSGCTYYLQPSKDIHSSLYTLPVLTAKGGDSNFVYGIPVNNTCKFSRNNSTFLKCDGTWSRLGSSILDIKTLVLQEGQHLYVGPYKPSQHPSLSGRLIRLPIQCSGVTWTPSQCIALKLKGNLNCTYSPGFSINEIAPADPPTEQTATTPAIPTTSSSQSTKAANNPRKEQPTQADLTTIIASSVAGGAGFVIIIICIIFLVVCLRRRKAKKAKKSQAKRGQDNMAYEQSLTLSNPNALRPLPEVPAWPYSTLQKEPSPIIRTPNRTLAAQLESSAPNTMTPNSEPVYGSIDDDGNYSRLDHTKQTIPIDPPHRNSYLYPPSPRFPHSTIPSKSGTLMSTGSNFSGFMPYDVVGGRIDGSLPRRDSTFLESADGRISPGSGRGYDVPEGVLRDTLERPGLGKGFGSRGLEEPSLFQSLDRKTLAERRDLEKNRGESYEAVWEDSNGDEFVAKIELE